eukprot:TRINITY_DN4226_c0_g1_i1.p1 TRINITY_DN4226_c0_g1~~TRINITY_DN4226_c0_g1_i1.p1  ORF type:complete len:670 (-),score=254.41 TRINITY_DN4226_c0_g1_i1:205-2214(-)
MFRKTGSVLLLAALSPGASAEDASPVGKVIELLDGISVKITNEGKAKDEAWVEADKLYAKRSNDLKYNIKTGTAEIEELKAKISKASSKVEVLSSTIEEAQNAVTKSEADLTAATTVREKEKGDFKLAVNELAETDGALQRAISAFEKKGGAALLQVQQAPNVLKAVEVMMSASMIGQQDAKSLTALLQQGSEEESEFTQPAVPAYQKKSGGIVEMLEDMRDKSKEQLDEARKKEATASGNFQMLTQSLQDTIKFSTADLTKAKQGQAEWGSVKAGAEKDLAEITQSLKDDQKTFSDLESDYKRESRDYQTEVKSREEELEAVGKAKDVLQEKASGVSFLQIASESKSHITSSAALKNFEVVRMVRDLAEKHHDQALSLLSRQMDVRVHEQTDSSMIDGKLLDMISGMIERMEKSLQEDTSKKAYCDEEMTKTKEKKAAKDDEVESITSKLDSVAASSTQLKSEVGDLQKALTEMASVKAEMTKLRQKEKSLFDQNEPELKSGIEGVKTALKVLRDFYNGQAGSAGGATGIIGMLEVAEGDFTKNLAEMRTAEKTAQSDFDKESEDLKLEVAQKSQDVKYKEQEYKRLDASLTDLKSDKDGASTELAAIDEYMQGIVAQCTETAASFAEEKAKREEEIAGLKSALEVLQQAGPSLLQRRLRGHGAALMP